jgi:uncharacterized membrane protein YheB (UPF0754 family)
MNTPMDNQNTKLPKSSKKDSTAGKSTDPSKNPSPDPSTAYAIESSTKRTDEPDTEKDLESESESRSDLTENSSDEQASIIAAIWDLVVKHAGMDSAAPGDTEPVQIQKKQGRPFLLGFLMAYPYLLVLLLAFSLYWDFNGITWYLFGKTIVGEGLLRILAVSGLIGFLTNWIAIEMLFRPRRKHPLLRQGLIPAQKERVALRLANAVSKDLINPDHIRHKMTHGKAFINARTRVGQSVEIVVNNPEFRTSLKAVIGVHIRDAMSDPELREELSEAAQKFINDSLSERYFERMALKIYTGIRGRGTGELIDDAITGLTENEQVISDIVDRVLDRIPPAVETESANLQDALIAIIYHTLERVDLRAIVEENLNRLDEEKLEMMIKGATNTQLNYIKYLGALIGTIGGFVIWSPLESLLVLGVLAAGIFSADWLLLRIKKSSAT